MVYRNISYRLDLNKYDPTTELWRKTENLRRSKNSKLNFEVQHLYSEGVFKDKMTFKNIPIYSAIIPAGFPIIFSSFQIKIDKHQLKSIFLIKIPHFYPLWGPIGIECQNCWAQAQVPRQSLQNHLRPGTRALDCRIADGKVQLVPKPW